MSFEETIFKISRYLRFKFLTNKAEFNAHPIKNKKMKAI